MKLSTRIFRLFSIVVLASAAAAPFAQADFKVKFDCYLPDDTLNCAELEKAFYSQFGYLSAAGSAAETKLTIQVRSNPIAAPQSLGTAYTLHFLGTGELPKFTMIDRIPQQVSGDNRFIRLLTNLDKGMAPFLALTAPAVTEGGETTMVFEDPSEGPSVAAPASNSRLYFSPSISGNYSKTQIENFSANGGGSLNWSGDRVRVQGGAYGSYSKIVMSLPGSAPISASVVSAGAQTIISYSFANQWSLAVIAGAGHRPATNKKVDLEGGVGVEWVLVPFMKTAEKNFSVRYAIGSDYMEFVDKNLRGEDRVLLAKHMIQLYCFWHFKTIDVSLNGSAESPVTDLDYLKVSAGSTLSYRLTKSLTLKLNFSVSRQEQMINEPAVQDTSNPVQSMISGGQYSDTSFNTMISLSYLFGNSGLYYMDQRWKDK